MRPILEQARPLHEKEIKHIRHILDESVYIVHTALNDINAYAEGLDINIGIARDTARIVAKGKRMLRQFLRYIVHAHDFGSPQAVVDTADIKLVLNGILTFNREVQKFHDKLLAECDCQLDNDGIGPRTSWSQ